jgi:hypothetical protein
MRDEPFAVRVLLLVPCSFTGRSIPRQRGRSLQSRVSQEEPLALS